MKKTTEAERQRYVEECQNSGKSKRAWCREKGIPYTTFANWVKNTRSTDQYETSCDVQWADVTPGAETTDSGEAETVGLKPQRIRLVGGGFEISVERGFDEDTLASVLRAVRRVCC